MHQLVCHLTKAWRVTTGLPDISYPNLFVPRRFVFVPQESLTLALTLTLTLALTRNSNTNT